MKKMTTALACVMSLNVFALCETATTVAALKECYTSASPDQIWDAGLTTSSNYQKIGKYCYISDSTGSSSFCDYYASTAKQRTDGKHRGLPWSVADATSTGTTGCLKDGDITPRPKNRQTCWTTSFQNSVPEINSNLSLLTSKGFISDSNACTGNGKLNAYKIIIAGVLHSDDPCGLAELEEERKTKMGATKFDLKSDDNFFFSVTNGKYQKDSCYYKYDMPKEVEGVDIGVNVVKLPKGLCTARINYVKGLSGSLNIGARLGGNLDTLIAGIIEANPGLTKAQILKAFSMKASDFKNAFAAKTTAMLAVQNKALEFEFSPDVKAHLLTVTGDQMESLVATLKTEDSASDSYKIAAKSLYEMSHGDVELVKAQFNDDTKFGTFKSVTQVESFSIQSLKDGIKSAYTDSVQKAPASTSGMYQQQ